MRHGGAGTGYAQGCRCAECRAAHTARTARRRNARYRQRVVCMRWDGSPYLFAPGPTLPHGTVGTYRNWGCRCDPCVAANASQCAQRRTRRLRVYTV